MCGTLVLNPEGLWPSLEMGSIALVRILVGGVTRGCSLECDDDENEINCVMVEGELFVFGIPWKVGSVISAVASFLDALENDEECPPDDVYITFLVLDWVFGSAAVTEGGEAILEDKVFSTRLG